MFAGNLIHFPPNFLLHFQSFVFLTWALYISEIPTQIYVTTDGAGIKSLSLETSSVQTVLESSDESRGITYDPYGEKMYYCNRFGTIFRANFNGTESETVFNSEQGKFPVAFPLQFSTNLKPRIGLIDLDLVNLSETYGLAFDPITGNLYAASIDGFILICSTTSKISDSNGLPCATVALANNEKPIFTNIALNPPEGYATVVVFIRNS